MAKRHIIFGIVLTVFGFTAVYAGGADEAPATSPALIKKMYNVADFDSIVADGYFNLSIAKRSEAKALVKTESYTNNPIKLSVQNHTLYIVSTYASHGDKSHPSVTISLANLKGLQVYGPVNVNSSHLPSTGLTLMAEGYGVIDLKDTSNIHSIRQNGNNVIKISGINSSSLDMYATGSGTATLQGKVKELIVRLNHEARLHARHLLADDVTIQAQSNSEATISPLKSLRAFTDQSGEVYYYNNSLTDLTRFSSNSGNVLRMQ